ncbi:MAG TPA: 3-hydroxyacyl-CoA dehydrogenase NAD-binding domain-containing protein [Actinocrinis sp.]|nr:3-hydroxyacyl-CoA dehydrogenase NAD-binding domain-containing protein [Actinocrinis sp.]HZU54445.1 3-hydroxyacyl-CoA dehydrogenase NAD-binding domain-containing protein [Actinocrinis sp.]
MSQNTETQDDAERNEANSAADGEIAQEAAGIRYSRDAEDIVTLTIDQDGPVNVMSAAFRADFATVVGRLEAERDSIRGVIVTSAKKTFFAGADLRELVRVTKADAGEFAREVEVVKSLQRRLERLGRPVAAAVNGSALGGGLEIALACHHRVVLDRDDVRLGFPEVTLGLIPGAGGVVRTVRMMGVQAAMPLIVEGKQLRPAAALKAGWADELASDADELMAKARAWVLEHPDAAQPWDAKPGAVGVKDLKPMDPNSYSLLAAATGALRKQTHGTMPAPEKALAVMVEGALLDFDTALAVEGRYFTELATGQIAKNLISTFFFQLNEVKAGGSRPSGHEKHRTAKVGVLGAGMMGAGIAQVTAVAGIDVVLKDVSAEAAEKGKATVAKQLDAQVAKGRLNAQQRDAVLSRIAATTDYADLAGCDLVIEAVFEQRSVKNEVNAAAQAAARPDAVIASNTSTLPITGLAEAVPDQGRFIGLHFFSPVPKMKLVEIIRGAKTSDATLARAYDYVLQIGKTPIVVNDSRGFYTSRTFGTYISEGVRLLAEGVPAALIENVAKKAGLPVGPLAVHDEVSLTLSLKVRDQTLADLSEASEDPETAARIKELENDPAFRVIEELVRDHERPGKAGGAGFYDYPADGPKRLWPGLAERYGRPDGGGVSEQDLRDRLLFIQAVETIRCLEENVLTSIRDANLGSIFGIGYPVWTGGTVQFVNGYGVEEFTARADYLADLYGERFRPPRLLREKAARRESF